MPIALDSQTDTSHLQSPATIGPEDDLPCSP